MKTVVIIIDQAVEQQVKDHVHSTRPNTLGTGVELTQDKVAFDLPWADEYFDRLINEFADFGAVVYVRYGNSPVDENGDPLLPSCTSIRDAASQEGLEVVVQDV